MAHSPGPENVSPKGKGNQPDKAEGAADTPLNEPKQHKRDKDNEQDKEARQHQPNRQDRPDRQDGQDRQGKSARQDRQDGQNRHDRQDGHDRPDRHDDGTPFENLGKFQAATAGRQSRDARTEYEEYEIYRRRRRKKRKPQNGRDAEVDQFGRERELERGESVRRDRPRSQGGKSGRNNDQKSEATQPFYEGIGLYDAQDQRTREWANGQSKAASSRGRAGSVRQADMGNRGDGENEREGQKHSRHDDERSRMGPRSTYHEGHEHRNNPRATSRAGRSYVRSRGPPSDDYFSDDENNFRDRPRRRHSHRPTVITAASRRYSPERSRHRGRSRADSFYTQSERPRSPPDRRKPLYGLYRQPSVDPRHDPYRPSEKYTALKAAKSAGFSALIEAIRCRSEPGPWKGQKAKRIALAAGVGTVIGALRSGRLQNSGRLPYAESAITGFYAVDFMKRVARNTDHAREALKEQREWREDAAKREDGARYRRRYSR